MNSFNHPISEVHFSKYKPEEAEEALRSALALVKPRLDIIKNIAKADRTFENTLLALSESTDELMMVAGLISHLESVLGEVWREADKLASEIVTELGSEIGLDKDLYKALKELKLVATDLKPNYRRLLDDAITGYELSGVGLPEDKRQRVKDISQQLSVLEIEFGQNVTNANDAAGILVEDVTKLSGLSESTIQTAKEAATKLNLEGYWLGYSEPLVNEVSVEAINKQTRDDYMAMCSSRGPEQNKDLILKILGLRQELAHILGEKNYSDLALKQRMAGDGQTALKFIQDMRANYEHLIKEEQLQVIEYAKKYENDSSLELAQYEYVGGADAYYASKLKQELFGVHNADTKPYFELHKVVESMFEVLNRLYGVRFDKQAEYEAWHPDVTCYKIYNSANQHIATVWCDWQTRQGKRAGAWMNSIYTADRSGGKVDQPHLGYVVANLPTSTASMPSLLTIRDVETIWHEFGHFMHHALGTTELQDQSMMSCKWDFIEAPSQIMENFVWEPEILSKMAVHYKTGEPIPEHLVEGLINSRRFRVASKTMRQLVFAETDLRMHQMEDYTGFDPVDFQNDLKKTFNKLDIAPTGNEMLTMLHIFAGGYQSAYYSYKWAEVIEADLYSRFIKDGPLNPQTGADYRDKVLARGDEADPDQLIRDFLGRDFNQEALLRRDGLL